MGRPVSQPCGTYAGYQRHRKAKEEPCAPCREAMRVYKREWVAARREGDPAFRDRDRDWVRRNPAKRRAIERKNRYGITAVEYDELVARQQGCCAVCRHAVPLQVDHDHTPGGDGVRGLLCGPCNKALGLMRDDPERLIAAAAYLRGRE